VSPSVNKEEPKVSDERAARSHSNAPEHLVDLTALDRTFVLELFAEADRLRAVRGTPKAPRPLAGKTAALVFHKPSLRTRVSFTVGMHELGGDAVDLGVVEVSETGRESVEDVAHVLSGMVDLVVVRTFSHRLVQRLAASATIPVINALTDHSHPCQILADLYTFKLRVAVPDGFEPDAGLYLNAEANSKGGVRRVRDPYEAVRGADMVYTDTWTSMGQEQEAEWRRIAFSGYTVDERMMAAAHDDAVFMHCLPAHRGEEVTPEVIDGPQSVVVEQAENRLHLQKALMVALAGGSWNRTPRKTRGRRAQAQAIGA